ncbi:hypothetical protein A2996_00085 [Candidatus Campbellbacteria bacterium RIFCSPLOWO2_01_FULL_34_15]|jgi:hypothetical protein|uniref:Uncharacterized protein n=2 Tax=Candidatus Campbelliibacteriota TaxID=1752727 RepID=A0A1F5ENM8_9BACT|nr:MAG: hypothetical protein A2811_00135 [Candidatus Campbellbacteria bacterium RIFCSPHIGHO2_01_FULL_34_10]OGD68920.1 MAG: hypothetical protein A2996_00085 [Candidatus Campbellbacteria bacterium RIFCSPLOWO2_01_FULL_34_15]
MSYRKYKIKFRWYGGWFVPNKKQEKLIDESFESLVRNDVCELLEQGKPVAMFEKVLGFDCWVKIAN